MNKRFYIVVVLIFFSIPVVSFGSVLMKETDIQSNGATLGLNLGSSQNLNFGGGDVYILNTTGNIGIGTNNPVYTLEVVGTAYFSTTTQSATPVNTSHAVTKSYVDSILGGGVGTGTSGQTLRNNGSGWVASSLLFNDATNIGIGTTSPTAPLHLYSAAPVGNVLSLFESGSASGFIKILSTGSSWNIGSTGSGFQFYNNNTTSTRVTIANSGNFGVGTTTPQYLLDVQGGVAIFDNPVIVGAPTAATHAATKNYIDSALNALWIGTSTLMYSGNSGNVGIGTINPQGKLEVVGTLLATGLRIGTSTTSGYALTVDVSGVGTWQALPGGGGSSPGGSSLALHSVSTSTCQSCPAGWTQHSCNAVVDESGTDVGEAMCYKSTGTPIPTMNVLIKGSGQSISCPSQWIPAGAPTNIAGNTELQCFYEVCTSSYTTPGTLTSISVLGGNTQITLTWLPPSVGACAQPSTYNIYRSATSGSGFSSIATGVTSTSYVSTGLTNGTTYYYKISGTNSAGEGAQSAEVNETAGIPPSNLSLVQTNGNKSFSVSWTAGTGNDGANGCKLQFYTGSTWTDITSAANVNCDADSSAVAYTLNADGWKTNWNGTQVRLFNKSKSVSRGTFSQTLTCTAQSASFNSATPNVDEDCNGVWDNYTQSNCSNRNDCPSYCGEYKTYSNSETCATTPDGSWGYGCFQGNIGSCWYWYPSHSYGIISVSDSYCDYYGCDNNYY